MGLVNSKLGSFNGYRWFLRCLCVLVSFDKYVHIFLFFLRRNSDQKTILNLVPDSSILGNFLSFLFYLIKFFLEVIVIALICHNFLLIGSVSSQLSQLLNTNRLKLQVPTTPVA